MVWADSHSRPSNYHLADNDTINNIYPDDSVLIFSISWNCLQYTYSNKDKHTEITLTSYLTLPIQFNSANIPVNPKYTNKNTDICMKYYRRKIENYHMLQNRSNWQL